MKLMTVKEVAAELGISRQRVTKLIGKNRLQAVKHGRDWVIDETSLAAVRVRKPGRPAQK